MHTQVLDGLAGGTPIDSDWEVFCYRVEVHLSTAPILGFRVLPTAMINLFMDSSRFTGPGCFNRDLSLPIGSQAACQRPKSTATYGLLASLPALYAHIYGAAVKRHS